MRLSLSLFLIRSLRVQGEAPRDELRHVANLVRPSGDATFVGSWAGGIDDLSQALQVAMDTMNIVQATSANVRTENRRQSEFVHVCADG